ncbi:F-box domain-containing protein [Mycena sanguinolenta]|uniref:F-box domain-containing protein n=1 Tax=Mycena sanguinolenta TaxID=230812 RepID=A0A8H6YCL5_9AGAR|nr:F-box domain-containing protein [Mycena sanguinolenta]
MNSPFSHLFSTNYVPTDEEVHHIRIDLISRTEELARLNERLRELSAQREQLQSYVDSHRALISSPRRLPPEIVREIFIACLPTRRNPAMSPQEVPLLLCRQRMEVHCTFYAETVVLAPHLLRFHPAQHIPDTRGDPMAAAFCSLSHFAVSLTKSSPRWRHVEFEHCSQTAADDIPEFQAPALESFKITNNSSPFNLSLINLAKTQTLRALSIQDSGLIDDAAVLASPLAWNRLTNLTIQTSEGALSLNNVLVILGRCTQLISFHFTPKERVPIEPADSVLVPSLEIFTIPRSSPCSPIGLKYLTEHLSMPQLRRFSARTNPFARDDSLFLIPLRTKSPPSLIEELTLDLRSLISQSLPQILRFFSSLITLVVCDTHNNQGSNLAQLLACLTPSPHTTLCPALQELMVSTVTTESEFHKSTLDAFIVGRMEFTSFRRLDMEFQYMQLGGYRRESDVPWESWVTNPVPEAEIQTYLLVVSPPRSPDPPPSPWAGLSLEDE